MTENERVANLIQQLLKSCERAAPGPWKYRENREDGEFGSYGDVHSLEEDRTKLRGHQSMVFESAWLQDGVFCCDARDYFPGSLRALKEIAALCVLTLQVEGAKVSPWTILDIIQKELVVESDKPTRTEA